MFPPPHSPSETADEVICLLIAGVFSLMCSASRILKRTGLSEAAMMRVLFTSCVRVKSVSWFWCMCSFGDPSLRCIVSLLVSVVVVEPM